MDKILKFIDNFDPTTLGDMSGEELAEICKALSDTGGVIEKIRKEAGQVLLTKFEGDGKVFGDYSVVRSSMPNYSKVDIETVRELGAVKEVINTTLLGSIIRKGGKVNGVTYSYYPRITNINEEKEIK